MYTVPATRFRDVSCAKVRNGMEVEVKGVLMSDGTVIAGEVKRDDDDDDDDDDGP